LFFEDFELGCVNLENDPLPRDSFLQYSNIEKLNEEADAKREELENRLLAKHEKNLAYCGVYLRCLKYLYYYYFLLLGCKLPPLYFNGQCFFVTTPSLYSVFDYHKALLTFWHIRFGGVLWFRYSSRCAMFRRIFFFRVFFKNKAILRKTSKISRIFTKNNGYWPKITGDCRG
jgi:hypothetical protein